MASTRTVKILTRQIVHAQKNPEPDWWACVDDNDILQVYFVLRGPEDSVYENGWYMGKFSMNTHFPIKAPDVYMFTPSGRFSINRKLCTTFTAYHPERWKPTWNIASLVRAMRSFFFDDVNGEGRGIGAINASDAVRRKHAEQSMDFNRTHHLYAPYFEDQLEARYLEHLAKKKKDAEDKKKAAVEKIAAAAEKKKRPRDEEDDDSRSPKRRKEEAVDLTGG